MRPGLPSVRHELPSNQLDAASRARSGVRSTTFPLSRRTSALAKRPREADECRRSARRSGCSELGGLHTAIATKPPGARREERIAASEVVSAGATVLVEESLVALQSLDVAATRNDGTRQRHAWLSAAACACCV